VDDAIQEENKKVKEKKNRATQSGHYRHSLVLESLLHFSASDGECTCSMPKSCTCSSYGEGFSSMPKSCFGSGDGDSITHMPKLCFGLGGGGSAAVLRSKGLKVQRARFVWIGGCQELTGSCRSYRLHRLGSNWQLSVLSYDWIQLAVVK